MIIVRSGGVWSSLASPNDATKYLSGTTIPSYTVPSATGGAGWTTLTDIDFTTLANQTFATDGTYTVAGLTATKGNSVNDATAMAIVSGTGLNIIPAATGDWNGTTRTAPYLSFVMTDLAPGYYINLPIRIWLYLKTNNITAAGQAAGFFLDNFGTSTTDVQVSQSWVNSSGTKSINNGTVIAGASATFQQVASPIDTTDNVMVFEMPNGRFNSVLASYKGAYSSGWPSPTTLIPIIRGGTVTGVLTTDVVTGLPSRLGIMGRRAGSGTAVSFTIGRLRVEAIVGR